MRPHRALLIYLALVFLGGALLAPWVHALMQALAGSLPALQNVASQPFARYLNRCFLFLALAGLWPLMRALGVRTLADLGLAATAQAWRNLGKGFLLGFASLALFMAICLAAGAKIWDGERTAAQIARHVFFAGLTASLVAVLEEVLFRGGIFGGLRRAYGLAWALGGSSVIFALTHFLTRPELSPVVRWDSGLVALPIMLAGLADVRQLLPGLFNLALVGLLLALAFHRSGSLHAAIGLHAGWVFWLKTGGFFTQAAAGASPWVWGTNKLIDGWMVLPLLLAVLPGVWGWFPAAKKEGAS
jgi:membrane protease YdiL (CAAX protease family)